MTNTTGTRLGRYEIRSKIGKGGMGTFSITLTVFTTDEDSVDRMIE